ncbi:MAG: recombinase family protein [Clostridia bacterium]|nr:recombinase family protein [Clostridia bacterium]
MKNIKQIAGLYFRLSQEDERAGESLSIDNQRHILRKYAEDNGFEIYGEYIDDGVSGTTFDRPQVQRLLDDAKTGVINTIIVKDLSRFGRNYIEVGQYLDYVFPAFGIRFIAIQDNVDTSNRDSNAMEMMPIMNVFNEWHAANTSKKIRAVRQANAKAGIYSAKKASYGYIKGTDKKRTPTIDEETAPIVRRIFELYASGISPKKIADILNAEDIPSPGRYAYEKYGQRGKPNEVRLWSEMSLRFMLNNIMYIGHLPMLQETTVSYKNHKRQAKDPSDWVITYNNHEPIISQELWDKVHERMKSVAQGRKTRTGFVHPLSGFLYCADCGYKLKMSGTYSYKGEYRYHFDCGYHLRFGKSLCFSHYIPAKVLEEGAIHLHGLVSCIEFDLVLYLDKNGNQVYSKCGAPLFRIKNWTYGLSTLAIIPPDDNYNRVCNYIQKYISKEGNIGYNAKRFCHTRNLDFKNKGIYLCDDAEIAELVASLGLSAFKDSDKMTVYRNPSLPVDGEEKRNLRSLNES